MLAIVCAAFLAAFVARRAFAANHDVVYACKGDRSGAIRIVSSRTSCLRGETLIHWNVQGPVLPERLDRPA
jgi:hypothetical protein